MYLHIPSSLERQRIFQLNAKKIHAGKDVEGPETYPQGN